MQAVSGVYETPPWGDPDQPSYYNAVVLVTGELTVERWLAEAMRIERLARAKPRADPAHARRRSDRRMGGRRDADHPPDRGADPAASPRPSAGLRARPWLEIQPYAQLPGHGWVNDLVLSEALADDVAAMTALANVQIQSTP